MSNYTEQLRNGCPVPFYNQDSFSATEGHIDGRLCQLLEGSVDTICCLPCPIIDWYYADDLDDLTAAADWTGVAGTLCCLFLLASWAFLPVEKTHRHYLSICLTIAVLFMTMGFVVPLAAQPEQCINEITPHDMSSSAVCAASGIFLTLGGFAGLMWVFLRALSLHLQICWQVVVGRSFMLGAHAAGWIIPIIIVSVSMHFSGVSFRFGPTCHINHTNSLADFWIPLIVFSGFTAVLQLSTFIYCLKVYLASLADGSGSTEGSNLPYSHSITGVISPRQAYRRVKRVVQLQWRGITIVVLILIDVIFFSVVFVFQDRTMQAVREKPAKARAWILCIMAANGDKTQCTDEASSLVISQPTVIAVLMLLACNGIWLLMFLGTWNMLSGWKELFMEKFGRQPDAPEFVSKDAAVNPKSYELLSRETTSPVPPHLRTLNTDADAITSPPPTYDTKSPMSPFSDSSTAVSNTHFTDKMGSPTMNFNNHRDSSLTNPRSPSVAGSNMSHIRGTSNTSDCFTESKEYKAPNGSFSRPVPPRSPPPRSPPPRSPIPPTPAAPSSPSSPRQAASPTWSPGRRASRGPRMVREDFDRDPLGMNQI